MKLSAEQTDRVVSSKINLQDRLWDKPEYSLEIQKLESEKQRTIAEHESFDIMSFPEESEDYINIQAASNDKAKKKLIEKTEAFKNWKAEVSSIFNEKINEVKDNLQDEYLASIANEVSNYDILMAIAEDIGYDATGRKTGKNELTTIAEELSEFINQVKTNKDPFFV